MATCSDAGVILRGEVSSDDDDAGPAKEKAIATACEDGRWPQAVIDCVAATPDPQQCLDELDDERRAAYEQRMRSWSDEFGEGDGDFASAALLPIECDDLIGDGAAYYPPSKQGAWVQTRRHEVLHESCDHDWTEPLKECLEAAAGDAKQLDACMKQHLPPDELAALVKALAELDRLDDRIEAAKKKPATITCAKVVAAHYGDAAWKQKLDGFKPAERKKMIAASRALMTKACTADKWDATLRACVVAGGEDTCFEGTSRRRWGLPATGAVTSVGIRECDDYSAEVTKLTSCQNLPAAARDSIQRSQHQMLAEIARVPAAERARMASSCQAAMDAIAMSLSNAGC